MTILKQSEKKGGKFLTFALGGEEYGIEILRVREIVGYMDITRVPRAPMHIKGVVNLRGQVIPVIDLRLKFCMPEAEVTEKTCIVVVEGFNADVRVSVGIIVDSVTEVVDIDSSVMDPPPDFGDRMEQSHILALAKLNNSVKTLLDVDKILFGDLIDLEEDMMFE